MPLPPDRPHPNPITLPLTPLPPTPAPPPVQAAVEEGIVTGGGCTLLRLSHMVDAFKATLTDDEQKVSLVI